MFSHLLQLIGEGILYVIFWIFGIHTSSLPVPKNHLPVENTHPKYFMTVKGNIAPALKDKVKLKWVASYYTTNPKCRRTINKLEGISSYLERDFTYQVKPDDKGNFNFKIPLDRFEPGICNWQMLNIEYYLNSATAWRDIDLSKNSKIASYKMKDDFLCEGSKCNLQTKKIEGRYNVSPYGILSTDGNYFFNLNIKGK